MNYEAKEWNVIVTNWKLRDERVWDEIIRRCTGCDNWKWGVIVRNDTARFYLVWDIIVKTRWSSMRWNCQNRYSMILLIMSDVIVRNGTKRDRRVWDVRNGRMRGY